MKEWMEQQWLSNLLSLLAILFSLAAFGMEWQRERKKADERRTEFLAQAMGLIEEAVSLLDIRMARLSPFYSGQEVNYFEDDGVPHVIEPIKDVVGALQMAAPPDAKLALILARTRRTLDDLWLSRGNEYPQAGFVWHFMHVRRTDLVERHAQLMSESGQPGRTFPDPPEAPSPAPDTTPEAVATAPDPAP
jgi:hypothetical protein